MKIPFDRSCLRSARERMDIADIAQATIRQSGDIARTMERVSFVGRPTYDDYVATDAEARRVAEELVASGGTPTLKP